MKRRNIRVGIALLVGSVLLAGCTSGNSGTGSSSQGTPDSHAVLTVASGQDSIPQLDPGLATLQWERVLYPLLWDGLTDVDKKGDVVPQLATSWKANDDFTQWTFTLRKGVKFSNGRALSADDIVWNAKRAISPTNASIAHQYMSSVTNVEATGADTVRFDLRSPNSVLPMAVSALRIIAPESEKTINTDPVGTGPFLLDKFVPSQDLKLKRNDKYWGTKAKVAGVEFVSPNDTAAAATALRTGDIQVLWNIATTDAVPLKKDKRISLIQADQSTRINYLAVDTSSAPFNDPKAREALALTLDRSELVNVAYSGFGDPADYNQLLPTGSWALDESALTEQKQDLDKASQLFAEAGVKKGDTLTWWGLAGKPNRDAEAQLIQASLAKIGIKLDIQIKESGTWLSKFIPVGSSYPGYIVPNGGGDPNDPAFIFSRLANGISESNWNSSEYNSLYSQGALTTDKKERTAIYTKLQKIVTDENPIIVTTHPPVIAAEQSGVSGAWVASSGDLRLEDAQLSSK